MHVDLEAKALLESKHFSEYCSNINTASRYPKLRAAVKPFLLAFPTLYREWWHSGQYFGLPITGSVVQFPLRTLIYALSSSDIEI